MHIATTRTQRTITNHSHAYAHFGQDGSHSKLWLAVQMTLETMLLSAESRLSW